MKNRYRTIGTTVIDLRKIDLWPLLCEYFIERFNYRLIDGPRGVKMRLLVPLIIISMISLGSALVAAPSEVAPGGQITITGNATPGEMVSIQGNFQMDLPVNPDGSYEFMTNGIWIPQKPNAFSVTASNVQNLILGVKFMAWLSYPIQATNGTAAIYQKDVPPGSYDIRVTGKALEGSKIVPFKVSAETTAKANREGKYSLMINTQGVPAGDYFLQRIDTNETAVVHILGMGSS